jgi:hypothetical protein
MKRSSEKEIRMEERGRFEGKKRETKKRVRREKEKKIKSPCLIN